MKIKINNNFTIRSDNNNYIVEEYGNKREKVGDGEFREIFGLVKTTYHPSVTMAIKDIIRRTPNTQDVQSIEELMKSIKELENRILNIVEKVDM